jgi:hypothetical protein
MTQTPPPPPRRGPDLRWLWGALAGGAIGFGLASLAYLLITPVLEASTGWVRELQGRSWNLVPGLTAVGAVTGGLLAGRRARRDAESPGMTTSRGTHR